MRDLSVAHHGYGSRITRDNVQEKLEGVQSVDRDGIVARINPFQTTNAKQTELDRIGASLPSMISEAETPCVLSRWMEQPIAVVR